MSSLPDFEGWAIFAKVVDDGSFAKAADSLGMSQPTVSKAVARLEKRLGTSLFYRTSRQLSLTPTGQTAMEHATRILLAGRTAEAEVATQAASACGTVRITAPMSFGLKYLAPLISEFLDLYPGVDIDLALNDRVVDLIAGSFDIAIRIAQLPDSSMRSRRLCAVRRPLVAAPSYFERYGRPAHPRELKDHACLIYTNLANPDQWRFLHETDGECTVAVTGPVKTNNADVILPALLDGKGLALQPEFIVWEQLERGELEEVLPDWRIAQIYLNLVTPPGRLRPARVQLLLDFLSERLEKAPWARM